MTWLALAATCLLLCAPFFGCCCTTNYTLTVNLRKCASAAVAGETVTVYLSGSPVASGTTNIAGSVAFTLAAGSYTITTTAPSHYDAGSGSATIVASNVSVTITLVPSTGYSCTQDACNPGDTGPPYPVHTWPSTMYLTDGVGTITLTGAGGTGPPPVYTGSATRTAALANPVPFVRDPTFCTVPSPLAGEPVPLVYTLSCVGGGFWALTVAAYAPPDNVSDVACPAHPCFTSAQGASPGYYYPANAVTGCKGPLAASSGDGYAASNTFVPSAGLPSWAGTVTISFFQTVGVTGQYVAPYQVYGASNGFGVSQ